MTPIPSSIRNTSRPAPTVTRTRRGGLFGTTGLARFAWLIGFSLAGTVVGVFTIQTLKSTITFLGVPPAVSPLFLAIVVVVVVLVQSPQLRGRISRLGKRTPRPTLDAHSEAAQ